MNCSAKTSAGKPCGRFAIAGGTVCAAHGGSAPAVKAKAALRAEVMKWTVGTLREDPGEVLLRMVTTAAMQTEGYARLIEDKVAEAQAEHGDGFNLEQILVGEVWVADESGGSHKAGEYVRKLVELHAQWAERAVNFAAKAVAAGLAERQVRLAERQGALLGQVLLAVMADPKLGFTEQQRMAMPLAIERHLSGLEMSA